MRGLLTPILIAATFGITAAIVPMPAQAECPCMKPHWDQIRLAQLAEQNSHLPSQSDLVTARGFVIEKLPIDAANFYLSAGQKAETELQDALHKNTHEPGAVPLDQVKYLTQHVIEIESEAISYFGRTGQNVGKILPLKEQLFKHHLDANDMTAEEKSQVAMELADAQLLNHNSSAAAGYYKLALDDLQQTKGRYSPDVIHLQERYQSLLAKGL